MRPHAVRVAFTLLAPILLGSCFLLVPIERTISTAAADDAYFYLTVARNAAHGQWSSFDGTSPTNGYHPLWAWLLTPLFLLVHDKHVALTIALVTGCVLHGITLHAIWRMLERRVSLDAARFGTAFFVLFGMVPGWYVGEAPLTMALFALFFERLLRTAPDAAGSRAAGRAGITLGLLAAATVFARLDAILPTIAALAWLWMTRKGHTRPTASIALTTTALLVGAYVIGNVVVHGHAIPVSGVLKSSFPCLSPINYPLSSPKWCRLLVPLTVALTFLGWRFVARRAHATRASSLHGPLSALSVGILGFFAYELLFQKDADHGLYSWHFAVATCSASLFAASLFDATVGGARLRSAASTALLIFGILSVIGRYALTTNVDGALADGHHAGRWIDANLPRGAVIAATDAGMIAYFGDRPTVNLDGLINDFDYQRVLRDRQVAEYLDAKAVTYIVVRDVEAARHDFDCFSLELPSRLYPGCGDLVTLSMQDRIHVALHGTATIFERVPGRRR